MKMKNLVGAFLALAAMFGFATVRAADIYDVHACDRYGKSIDPANLPFYTPDESMGSGVTAYFKVRFLPRQEMGQFSTNLWQFVYTGLSSQNVQQPKIGIFVSGVQSEATYIGMPDVPEVAGTLPTGEAYYYSDLIFAYTTKPGDFALPVVLAAKGADGRPTPASDVSTKISEYFLVNQGQNGWKLQFPMYDGSIVPSASWSIAAGVPNLSRLGLDPSLSKAGYCVKTVDFAAAWEKPGEAWRVVHQGSTKTEKYEPQLEARPAAAVAEVLYVWSDDESSVVVDGREVTSEAEWQSLKEKLSLKEPVWMTRNVYLPETGKTKTRRVAMVKIDGGATTGDLTLRGVTQNTSTKLYLSAYDHFNVSDATSDDVVDYVTVPVACSEPLPPSVTVTTSTADAIAAYNYGHAAARITVSLPSADYAATVPAFTVKLMPRFNAVIGVTKPDITQKDEDGNYLWGEYVRFSADLQDVGKNLPEAKSLPTVTLGGGSGKDTATFYVFCLRADKWTQNENLIEFVPSSEDAPEEIATWTPGGFNVTAQTPEITEPEEGAKIEGNVYQYDDYPLTVKVEGSYADGLSSTGYTVRVRYGNGDFETLSGTYFPNGEGNVLTKTGTTSERPVLNFPTAGENQTADIEVIAPASGRKSSEPNRVYRRVVADVNRQKTVAVKVTKAQKAEPIEMIDEGQQVAFTVYLSDAYAGASEVYAFLQLTNDYVTAGQFDFGQWSPFVIGCTNRTTSTVRGLLIPKGGTESKVDPTGKGSNGNRVTLLDGYDEYDGGLMLNFNVLLSTEPTWEKAKDKLIKGYSMDSGDYFSMLTVTNVAPSVKSVKLDGTAVKTDPENPTRVAASDTRWQKFEVALDEPSDYDVKNDVPSFYEDVDDPGLRLKWEAYLDGEYQAGETLADFHSKTVAFSNLFETVGSWEVRIWAKDKDMADFTDDDEPTYVFPLEVVDSPTIIVNGGKEMTINEKDSDRTVEVELSLWPKDVTGTLVVELTNEVGRAANGDWGEFVLQTNRVEFTKSNWNKKQSIAIVRLDGTDNTSMSGWDVKGKALAVVSASGMTSTPPNLPCVAGRVYVDNDNPNKLPEQIGRPSFSPMDTNVWEVAGGAASDHPLSFFVRDDVERDLTATATNDDWKVSEGVWTNGIKVTISGGGGESYNSDGFRNGVKYFSASGNGKFIPNFGSSQGPQKVTITIEDKDGGFLSYTWNFTVTPSKYLTTVATGPSGGTSSSALSQKYSGASGLGEGHVFALDKTFTKANDFRLHWNCSKDAKASLYAWGYKVGAVDDGKLDTHDQPLDTTGAAAAGVAPETYYRYGDPELDSFLYCWIQTVTDEKGAETSSYLGALAPERAAKTGASMAEITLPDMNKDAKDNVYPETVVEAIFAREWLATDNMGDINWDGIPDLYVNQYKFDVIDETTGAIAEGGKDLKSLRDFNADLDKDGAASPDYLPTGSEAIFGTFVPDRTETWKEMGKEFTALLEIRGYGYGLNDAPVLAGITGVKPDRIYEDPDLSPTSTLSKVEFLAWSEFKAAYEATHEGDEATVEMWSPERPTSPILDDTDGDEFADGYEYYFWYKAHVGYLDANGVHRYLTGRAYDPRNPGEGKLIDSATIARMMDPRHDLKPVDFPANYVEDPSNAKTRDTDNDGLPDLLEFLIGTNPFDFDTDGDGLPDGFEIIVAGTDPLTDHTAKDAKHDAARNYDGDAMAFTTVKRESGVLPLPRFIQRYYTFATVDPDGDTDGIQWYVETPLDGGVSAFTYDIDEGGAGVRFTVGGVDYVTTAYATAADLPVVDGRLAVTLDPHSTFAVTNAADAAAALGVEISTAEWLRLKPTHLLAGTPIAGDPQDATFATATVKDLAAEGNCNAAWVYGSEKVNVSGSEFGFLALGRYRLPKAGDPVAELPTKDRDVAFLHYLVYQQWGFDPRTAWSPKTPLAARWGKTDSQGQALAEQVGKLGYAGTSTRTRAFTAYDEFLLYSFFLNNGCDMSGYTEAAAEAPYLAKVWMAFCTNPRGVGEPEWASNEHYEGWTAQRDENGCDTDGDGVPDGWELYVMSGPKIGEDGKADPKNGKFVFAPPYAGFTAAGEEVIRMPESYFSPFVDSAQDGDTDNEKYIGKSQSDSLTEYDEFVSTDACAWYDEVQAGETAPYAKTPLLPADWKWLNKFFPTDPWVPDTDDDGMSDSAEGGAFNYATAEDVETYKADKTKTVYPGCGLNPLSVDTDMDGIPDGWENQFAGKTVSTNAVEGYIDGMDGTVADAQTSPDGPNRDYDRDGLENWQEYLTGTMRCWRYDDPFTQWGSIPFEAYYYYDADGFLMFEPDFEALGIEGADEDELWNNFWYETLAHVGGPIYNPHLVFDQSPTAQYFSRVDKGWDPNYFDKVLKGDGGEDDGMSGAEHRYYWFAHRIGAQKYSEAWASAYGENGWFSSGKMDPKRYVSCSPICEDSDQDGLDDFYELFHGLNPLLGGSSTPATINPCDLVWANAAIDKVGPANWSSNPWIARPFAKARGTNPDYDFTVYPWKNGLQTVDPDGDNERNYVEAIMAKFDSVTGFHGDPSPMWMTDASYSNSLTRLHYRMPMNRYGAFMFTTVTDRNGDEVPGFTGPDGTAYFFRDFDAYSMNADAPGTLEGFSVDRWKIGGASIDPRVSQVHYDRGQESVGGWAFSFEENEGYDTDHDGVNDAAEIAGRAHGATDPIDFDDPRRRQAMYFPGEDSALQTPPQLIEQHPVVGGWYDEEFPFREYTVECWVRPDDLRDATVVERAILTAGANAGDRELVRKNFQLAIRKSGGTAYWFTKFDSNGTGATESDEVSVLSADEVVPGVWTHLAATFDGTHLTLFVNGKPSGTAADTTDSKQQPECGVSEINIRTGGTVAGDIYKTDGYTDGLGYGYHAIVVGASVRSYSDYDLPFTEQWCGYALNLYNTLGWRFYRDFFKGYVDEVRIWDGARSVTQIAGSMGVRFTAEMAKENRAKVYDQWKAGQSRYRKDGNGRDYEGIEPELRYHFTFDSLLAADSAEALAKVPTGFANGPSAPYSRPDGYEIAWWKRILDTYGSAYAGAANYVTWIPNTVAHLPRFDGTTLDSAFWSADFAGDVSGTYTFANAAEPYSLWTQWLRGNIMGEARSTLLRYYLANSADHATTGFMNLFMFTGRNQLCEGCDLLPLGGAFARYCDSMWDGQGPSTTHEITGDDSDSDGLPNWWEKYADEQYRGDLDPSVKISWDTVIDYHGMKIAAGEAYLRDLAKGAYGDGNGKIAELPSKYLQVADEDANGIPDWWANLYGIRGESGLDDHDNDGLPNYVEYLLSEVFDFKVMFNPVRADSVRKGIPDYFYRPEGCHLYVGEIFTDHDLVDDVWEDLYPVTFASRLAWDAFADADQDGWSNRSENRYAKAVMPIVADRREHNTPADGLVADYPIPTISLKLSYNGNSQYDVSAAPMAIQVTTEPSLERDPDATYLIGAAADQTAGTGTDSDKEDGSAGTEVARTRTIGKWSDRHVIGTLTPGNIKIDSIKLQNCYDPSSTTYAWRMVGGVEIKRGTRSEYDEALRKYGSSNIELVSTTAGYKDLQDLTLKSDEKSIVATWTTKTGDKLGTVNLVTGEYELNLGVFKGWTVTDASDTNKTGSTSMEDQTFRIAYATNPSVGLPRELYLGEADTGHVKEGKNTIVAWAETVAVDGKWQVGEPYGIVRDVDISWRGTKAEIELTDISPVTPRIDLTAAGGSGGESPKSASAGGNESSTDVANAVDEASDRGRTFDQIRDYIREYVPDLWDKRQWLDNNRITAASVTADTFRGQRIRVVRWLINDVPVYLAGVEPRVILDKTIETDVRDVLTEADFLVGNGTFDIDSDNLYREVITWPGTIDALMGNEVTSMSYLIVVGDGDIGWKDEFATNTVVALPSVVIRRFGEKRVTPAAVAPGAVSEEIVHGANPTFKWTMDCPEDEGYTAFNVQVMDGSTLVYDSDKQLAPSRNAEGQYVWTAPLYVGDKTLKGKVFENKRAYTWKVSMYNAKYSNGAVYSNAGKFLMEVQTNGYEYGTANVAVRYFGPKSSYQKSYQKKDVVIRVRAYTSPDFTGIPVAAGYVANPDDPANGLTAGTNAAPNCTVVGIPKGTYYLQAFIDSNANGACDPWETQGYLCTRDGTTPDYLDPTAITFDSKVGKGDLAVIYLEDADIDGDGLPDAWEYAEFGSIEAKGVERLAETKAGEFAVAEELSGELALQENANVPTAELAGEIRNTIMKLRSPAGVSAATGIDPADVEVTDGGLEVKSEIDPETLTIVGFAVDAAQNRVLLKVGAETTADINPTVANFLNITVKKGAEVTVKVEHAESPNGPWTELKGVDGTVTVDRAGADIEVKLNGELPAQGYFRAKVEE